MKKLSLILLSAILPMTAFAARTGQGTCDSNTTVPAGYCCISYYDNGSYVERFWNCDNLDISESTKADCKKSRYDCINYCSIYDLDNNTCSERDECAGWQIVDNPIDATDCTIPNAEICEYELVCDLCGNNCHHENEEVTACIDGYYNTEDWLECLPCPGNGMIDYDLGNVGSAQCYILRTSMNGSDKTGAFQYINEKCYYKE